MISSFKDYKNCRTCIHMKHDEANNRYLCKRYPAVIEAMVDDCSEYKCDGIKLLGYQIEILEDM